MRSTALLLLVSVSGMWQAIAEERNLLPNPGFEQVHEETGYPSRWRPVWGKATTCAYTLAVARSGVACALITDDATDQSHGLRSEHVRVTPDHWYEASVWVRIEPGVKHGFALYLEFWNNVKVRGEHKTAYTTETGRWLKLSIRMKAPPTAHTATVLIYGSSATVGKAYFDDARLVQMKRKGAEAQREEGIERAQE